MTIIPKNPETIGVWYDAGTTVPVEDELVQVMTAEGQRLNAKIRRMYHGNLQSFTFWTLPANINIRYWQYPNPEEL